MVLIDIALLMLISTVACLILPKFLSILLAAKTSKPQTIRIGITSFPYCTAYALTGSQGCKFSPNFCDKCSPN
jgi:Na+/proline symporter